MFDVPLRRLLDPLLNRVAATLAGKGVGADQISVAAAFLGLSSAIVIASFGSFIVALVLFLGGRVLDGLDGAVARQRQPTDFGGFLDIVLDFAVYAAMPLAFAFQNPDKNALAAAVLLGGFLVNGATFFAFAVMAERRKLETRFQAGPGSQKSIYYLVGLAEGSETIAVFAAMCIWPDWFASLALMFAVLCFASAVARGVLGWRVLSTD
jgi:phosphatidylglycerophosphate synthase